MSKYGKSSWVLSYFYDFLLDLSQIFTGLLDNKAIDITPQFFRLEVQISGKPKPKGKWLKHGEEIQPSNEFVIEDYEDGTCILTISEVYPDDTGEIVYEAHNPLGVAITSTQLLVETVEGETSVKQTFQDIPSNPSNKIKLSHLNSYSKKLESKSKVWFLLNFIPFIHNLIFSLGIVGTKEYRKPEWVTHMEELQVALKGNESRQLTHASFNDLSIDSLEKSCSSNYEGKDRIFEGDSLSKRTLSQVSFSSIKSEPIYISTENQGFVHMAMNDYLNCHRHSISTIMELIDFEDRDRLNGDDKSQSNSDLTSSKYSNCSDRKESFFLLSPIEEKSETSTRSSSFHETSSSEKRLKTMKSLKPLSLSFDILPSERNSVQFLSERDLVEQSSEKRFHTNNTVNTNAIFPLEPRELDPSSFFQLHTADSQEELQEFLLLESECMVSNCSKGLANAFVHYDSDDSCSYER